MAERNEERVWRREEGTKREKREGGGKETGKERQANFYQRREMTKEIIFHPTHTVKVIMKTKNNMENVRVTLAEKYILKSWEGNRNMETMCSVEF